MSFFKSIIARLNGYIIRKVKLKNRIDGFRAEWKVFIDSDSTFGGMNFLYGTTVIKNSKIGYATYVSNAKITNTVVGRYCSIGPEVIIGGLGDHPTSYISTHPCFYSLKKQCGFTYSDDNYYNEFKPTVVGNDVWIGARATILDGCTIGDGAIIAAGSVVTKDVQPFTVVGGVPAKAIRRRFNDEHVSRMKEIKWWSKNASSIQKNSHLFRTSDVEEFCKHFESYSDEQ